jgi:hypothetical protein
MQHRTFDRLTRTLAAQPTRRGFLGGLGALVAAGFAGTALGQRRDFEAKLNSADGNPDEQLVLFFEEVGRITAENDGTCDDLASKLKDFRDTYFEKLESLRAVELTWSKDRLIQHVNTYAERREAVVAQVTPALERCVPESDESGEATPVAMFPSADLAALVPTGMERAAVDDFYSQSASCSADNFNFMAEAYCYRHNSDWQSPSFQWQAYCPSGVIDDKCDLCATDPSGTIEGAGICTKYWPQDCIKDGVNVCAVDYHDTHGGLASAICDKADASKIFSDTTYCYSRESSWSSPKFTWSVYCPDGHIEHNCIDCQTDAAYVGLAGPEICAKYWPQDCLMDGTRNICYVV